MSDKKETPEGVEEETSKSVEFEEDIEEPEKEENLGADKKVSDFQKKREVAYQKLQKLYSRMEPGPEKYPLVDVVKAIKFNPDDEDDKLAVSLAWHQLFDEGKVAKAQFCKPEPVDKVERKELPVI